MNRLKVGFSREVITPKKLGIQLSGYGDIPRPADGVLDDLELNVAAFEADGKKTVLMVYDLCHILTDRAVSLRDTLSKELELPLDAVFLTATHTHTGPFLTDEYMEMLTEKSVKAAKDALDDLKPAKMGYKVGNVSNVAFVRRFRMKDGSVRTNPGVGNPDILKPLGDVDERVNVLRFDREGGETVTLVNFGNHPDTVGGTRISADWPGFTRRTVEKAIENTKCIFINGAEGDVNHINVNAEDGDLNGTFNDFDDVYRGYDHARFIGRAVAGAVLQVYDKVNYRDVENINYKSVSVKVPSNMPTPEEVEKARLYAKLEAEGRRDEIPFKGMELTTVVFEAKRMVRLEHGPEFFNVLISALSIGPVAFCGIQGEPFTGIGRALKDTDDWEMVLPVCNANGKEGYFPMKSAYDEGGYESRSSLFKAGVDEILIKEGKNILKELKK